MLLSMARGARKGSRDFLISGCDDAVLLVGLFGSLGFVGCKKEDRGVIIYVFARQSYGIEINRLFGSGCAICRHHYALASRRTRR